MRTVVLTISAFCFSFLFLGCGNSNSKSASDSMRTDTSMSDITRPAGTNFLEDLLDIKGEAELKSKFASEKISYDTIWGAEGMFNMGTYLNKSGKNEVQIMWKDSLHRAGVASVTIQSQFSSDGKINKENQWCSRTGIKLGTTTGELEKINGRSFSFSGFDWDYGGGVGDWKKGSLEDKGISLTLTQGNYWDKISEKEQSQVEGDQTVMSDNAVVKKLQPQVVTISVYRPN